MCFSPILTIMQVVLGVHLVPPSSSNSHHHRLTPLSSEWHALSSLFTRQQANSFSPEWVPARYKLSACPSYCDLILPINKDGWHAGPSSASFVCILFILSSQIIPSSRWLYTNEIVLTIVVQKIYLLHTAPLTWILQVTRLQSNTDVAASLLDVWMLE